MRVAIVGAGISGLATAWFLRHGPHGHGSRRDVDVVLLEAGERPGGKLWTVPFGPHALDVGADAFLARRPEARRLAVRLGLEDQLVAPRSSRVRLWIDGELRPLPGGTVFGAPTDALALARSGTVGARAVAATVAEPFRPRPWSPQPGGDASVAEVLAPRLGREIVDVLVEPLLGGVYAGSVDRLSIRATTPMLADAAQHPHGLVAGLRAYRRRAAAGTDPVFLTLRGGLGTMVGALVDQLAPGTLRTGCRVGAVEPAAGGWRLATTAGVIAADHVVLATPVHVTAALLRGVADEAAGMLAGIRTASVAVVTLAYPRAAATEVPDGSGMLVPRTEDRLMKAATWNSGKWPHLADASEYLVRCSVGRVDEPRGLSLDDAALARRVDEEAQAAMGLHGPALRWRVTRWPGALPQYEVGHLARVADARSALPPELSLAGNAYDGIGIAPCVAQAERIAGALLA